MVAKRDVDRLRLTYEQAVGLIQTGEYVHTFLDCGVGLIGCDNEREEILKLLEEKCSVGEVEIGGEGCRGMKHGIVVLNYQDGRHLFVREREGIDWLTEEARARELGGSVEVKKVK